MTCHRHFAEIWWAKNKENINLMFSVHAPGSLVFLLLFTFLISSLSCCCRLRSKNAGHYDLATIYYPCSYGKEIFVLILIAFTWEGGCRRRRKLSLFLMPTNTRGCYRHQEPSILFNTTNDIPARQQILICRYCSVVLWSAIPPSETIARGSTLLLRVVGRLPLPHHPLQCSFWPGIALIIN